MIGWWVMFLFVKAAIWMMIFIVRFGEQNSTDALG